MQKIKLSKYVAFKDGFIPTTETFDKLKAGMYDIKVNQGQIYLAPMDFIQDDLMVLEDSFIEEILSEIKNFLGLLKNENDPRAKVFKKMNYIHKRGYLFHGPPGSGKTAIIMLVAAEMIKEGHLVLVAKNPDVLAAIVSEVREIEPERPIMLILEELDSIIYRYGEDGLASFLDGESQVNHVITMATTNKPEEIGEKFTNRPSRFDRVIYVDLPSEPARESYLKNVLSKFRDDYEALAKKLASQTDGFSIAHLRDLIFSVYALGNDIDETIGHLSSLSSIPATSIKQKKVGIIND